MNIIKIIKKRIRPTITKRFICANCGYIWKAEKGDNDDFDIHRREYKVI